MRIEFELDDDGKPVGRRTAFTGPAPRPTGETLHGTRVRLERFSVAAHGHDLYEAFAVEPDGGLWTYMFQGPFANEADFIEWATSVEGLADPFFYAIVDNVTGKAIGIGSYLRIDPNNRSIEVGWLTFSRALQRTPGATEAMTLMAAHAFDLGYHRYEWKCNALNAPSIAAAERLGFSFEGVFRDAVVTKGRHRDTAWFAFTADDWPAIHTAHTAWLDASNFDESGQQRTTLRDATRPLLHAHWPTLTVSVEPLS